MNKFFSTLRETLNSGYRYYFYLWLLAIFILSFSTFFFIKEFKYFLALRESRKRINESIYRLQPQVVRIKDAFKTIDTSKDFRKKTTSVILTLDLRNLPKTLMDLQRLSNRVDSFFLIQRMVYKQEKDKTPILLLQGVLIKYN